MQVFSGLPISQGLAAGKIVFLGAQKAAVRQAVSPQASGCSVPQPHSSRP